MYQVDGIENFEPYDQFRAQHIAHKSSQLGVPGWYIKKHLWELEIPLYASNEQAARVFAAMYRESQMD